LEQVVGAALHWEGRVELGFESIDVGVLHCACLLAKSRSGVPLVASVLLNQVASKLLPCAAADLGGELRYLLRDASVSTVRGDGSGVWSLGCLQFGRSQDSGILFELPHIGV
jgi:hypothetical protein